MKRKVPGFALVEVLVAMAIATVVGLGIMTMMKNMSLSTRNIEEASEAQNISDGLTQLLTQYCANNFNAITLGATNTAGFKNGTGTVIYHVSGPPPGPYTLPYTGSKVTITSWSIVEDGRTIGPAGFDTISGHVALNMQTINSLTAAGPAKSLGAQVISKSIPLEITVKPSGATVTNTVAPGFICAVGGSGNSGGLWEYSADGTDIVPLSSAAKVGIGVPATSNPVSTLQVVGDITTSAGTESGNINATGDVISTSGNFSASATSATGIVTLRDSGAALGRGMAFSDGGTTFMFASPSGGTGGVATTGTAALTLNGDLSCHKITSSSDFTVNGNLTTAATSNIVIDATGNVSTAGTMTANAFFYSSDRTLKRDIEDLDGLALIEKLKGHRFVWKATGKPDMGVIAQEIEKILPDLVTTTPKGTKAVKYDSLIAPLIEAVKTQQKEIQELRAQIGELKTLARSQAKDSRSKTSAERAPRPGGPDREISGK